MEEIDLNTIRNENVPIQVEQVEEEQPEQVDPNYGEERAKKIRKIEMFMKVFPHKLTAYAEIPIYQLQDEQLDALLDEFRIMLNGKSNIDFTVQLAANGIYISEHLLCAYTPIKAKGLSSVLQDQEFLDDIKLFAMNNLDIIETSPESRIIMKLCQTLLTVHAINSKKESENIIVKDEVNKDKKYDSL